MEEESPFRDLAIIKVVSILDTILGVFGSLLVTWFFLSRFFSDEASDGEFRNPSWLLLMAGIILMYLIQLTLSMRLFWVHKNSENDPFVAKRFCSNWLVGGILIFFGTILKFSWLLYRTGHVINVLWGFFGLEILFRLVALFFVKEFIDDLGTIKKPRRLSTV